MTERFAIYYAPDAGSALWQRAETWLARPELQPLTASARRYGFHATIKAPMALAEGCDGTALEVALTLFAGLYGPVALGRLTPTLIEGFLALTPIAAPQALSDFAATVVADFDRFRAPLMPEDRARRLGSPLSARQIELLDLYGYPYVLDEFRFHMTLTDRLAEMQREALRADAVDWFADIIDQPMHLDRLVLYHEAAPGEPFRRLDRDFPLTGAPR